MNQAGGPKGRTAAKLTVRERFHTVCNSYGSWYYPSGSRPSDSSR